MKLNNKKNIRNFILVIAFIFVYSTIIINGSQSISNNFISSFNDLQNVPSIFIVFIIICIISLAVILYIVIDNSISTNEEKKEENLDTLENQNNKIDIPFNETEFKKEVFYTYEQIKQSLVSYDYETIKKFTTGKLCDSYCEILDRNKENNYKYYIKNIKMKNIQINNITESSSNYVIDVTCNISYIDYLMDSNDNIIRGELYKPYEEKINLSFIKNKKIKELDVCPKCNHNIKNIKANKCSNCGYIILADTTHLLLIKEKVVDEK